MGKSLLQFSGVADSGIVTITSDLLPLSMDFSTQYFSEFVFCENKNHTIHFAEPNPAQRIIW